MRADSRQNAVGNLLLHLNGNVRQWILHGVGGAPDLRDRDAEFAARDGAGANELLGRLRATVEEAAALLRVLPAARLMESVRTQGYDCTVLAAVYHVVAYAQGGRGADGISPQPRLVSAPSAEPGSARPVHLQ